MIAPDAQNALAAALVARSRCAAEIDAARAKAAEHEHAAAADEAEAVEIESAALERDTAAVESGECLGRASDEEREATALRKQARARRHAAETARAGIPKLESQLGEADLTVTNAALTHFRQERDAAHVATVEALAGLVLPLARLVAADRVRRTITGDKFRFDAHQHPPAELWAGEHFARAFIAALPNRLRPETFDESIEHLAQRLAAETLAALKGDAECS